MNGSTPFYFTDPDLLADAVIAQVGKDIRLAMPLGLGKANDLANALFARAVADPTITLHIFTALTLEIPRPTEELEKRFLEPIIWRAFSGYRELSYAKALHSGEMPPNIQVSEFFFQAGQWLGCPAAQRNYISANYTHALNVLLSRNINVIGQLVAKRGSGDEARYSLSCNTDITPDLLKARDEGKANFLFVGQVNSELPFMPGEAEIPARVFNHVLEGPQTNFSLFAPPKEPVTLTDHAIGMHVARLVADGGTLQIGIGSIGDAIASALILRHAKNTVFRDTITRLMPDSSPDEFMELAPFETGLYGSSEMLVDSFLDLMNAGVLKREVDGAVLEASFFVGPKGFYTALRDMPADQLAKISMRPVSWVNQLYGDEKQKTAARVKARFINSALMTTLLGAAISDGLDDGRVISGVGGQYDFVAQAFALPDARSVIALRATRKVKGIVESNIRWSYGHVTIPRHLRDIVVTEYGIADLRGKSDRDVIAEMLKITDSRFQSALLIQAKAAGKIEKDYEIPVPFRQNLPSRISTALVPLREYSMLRPFPFGTDLSRAEQLLALTLLKLKQSSGSSSAIFRLFFKGLRKRTLSRPERDALSRMGLEKPRSIMHFFYARLLRGAFSRG